MSQDRLLERFLRYVRIDTTAADISAGYPSSPGQLTLGKMLADELIAIGLAGVEQDENGVVMATLPSNVDGKTPTVAFNSHVDTSPESPGANVNPQVIRNYAGGDVPLPGDAKKSIRVAENPELKELIGKTLITTDGTTLLGADDKAGVAAIVEAVHRLVERPELPHGPIRVMFTCDEETGHGADKVDLEKLAADVCYTLDGPGAAAIDVETFSADMAEATITGINIHPSIGKDRMVNAVRAAGVFLSQLPAGKLSPETTDGREGFLHPYKIEGGVGETKVYILLRDFDAKKLSDLAEHVRIAATKAMSLWPGARVDVVVRPQYRNMAEGLEKEPRAVALAEAAYRKIGAQPRQTIIRGGTDGSRFTEMGLPTPNLSVGQHNPHSPLEWACLEEMEQAVEVVIALAGLWSEQKQG